MAKSHCTAKTCLVGKRSARLLRFCEHGSSVVPNLESIDAITRGLHLILHQDAAKGPQSRGEVKDDRGKSKIHTGFPLRIKNTHTLFSSTSSM